jgi:small subunit ribosomal protein S21
MLTAFSFPSHCTDPRKSYICAPIQKKNMLIIPVKEGEPIDKALKKFKKKFERTGTLRALRKRQAFTKPSVERRKELLRAAYKEEKYGGEQ